MCSDCLFYSVQTLYKVSLLSYFTKKSITSSRPDNVWQLSLSNDWNNSNSIIHKNMLCRWDKSCFQSFQAFVLQVLWRRVETTFIFKLDRQGREFQQPGKSCVSSYPVGFSVWLSLSKLTTTIYKSDWWYVPLEPLTEGKLGINKETQVTVCKFSPLPQHK